MLKSDHHFITDTERFREMELLVEDVFHSAYELPQQVFRDGYSHFLFQSFDTTMEPQFWTTLKKLAQMSHDNFVLLGVLQPNPENYFYKEFKCFNWYELPLHLSEDEYWEWIETGPLDSPVDAILYNSFTVVWVSPSKQWAIWGDRNPEICVLGFEAGVFDERIRSIVDNWTTIGEPAVTNWVSLACRNEKGLQEFMSAISSNYSC